MAKVTVSVRNRKKLLSAIKAPTAKQMADAVRRAMDGASTELDPTDRMRRRVGKRVLRMGRKPGTRAWELGMIEMSMKEAENALYHLTRAQRMVGLALLQIGDSVRAYERIGQRKPAKKARKR